MNTWHEVTLEDQKRIICDKQGCNKKAVECEHVQTPAQATIGAMSFFYYCQRHANVIAKRELAFAQREAIKSLPTATIICVSRLHLVTPKKAVR